MKRAVIILSVLAGILAFQGHIFAEIELNGYIEMDNRLKTESPGEYFWNRNTLGIKANAELSSQILGYGEIKLQSIGFPNVSEASDLASRDKTSPYELELREAYMDFYGIFFDNMDLRIGKQRIAWGSADKLNPTDNLNPYDFTDLLEFGEKIPTNAIKVTNYLGETTLTTAIVPVFTPAIMPSTYGSSMSSYISSYLQPMGLSLVSMESTVTLPAATGQNTMFGIKLARNIWEYDMSVSYFNGYDSVPNLSVMTITTVSASTANASLSMDYPKIQVIGYDIAGTIGDVGVWGEAAFFTPDNVRQSVFSDFGSTTIEVETYTKYTIGCDYNFDNGVYVNAQLMHGFFDERGTDLTDLILGGIENKFADDKWKIALMFGCEVDLEKDEKIEGTLIAPQLIHYPADAAEITLSVFGINGENGSKLEQLESLDQVCLKFKYSF